MGGGPASTCAGNKRTAASSNVAEVDAHDLIDGRKKVLQMPSFHESSAMYYSFPVEACWNLGADDRGEKMSG